MNDGSSPSSVENNLKISIELPEVFRSWFWTFYDHFGRLLLLNFSWSICTFSIAWVWSSFFKPPTFGITLFAMIFLFLVTESLVSVGWAYGVFKLFMDRRGGWGDIWDGYRRFGLKGSLIAVFFWSVVLLGLFNLQFLWSHPLPSTILNDVLLVSTGWILLFWSLLGFFLWPVLFFQQPSIPKVFYRAMILAWDSAGRNVIYLIVIGVNAAVFTLLWPLWFFVGPVSIFSLQSVALEKALLKYKITFEDKDIGEFLSSLERERERNWREFLRPWDHR